MANGVTRRTTARYGLRVLRRVGLLIMTATGLGSNRGGGPGLMLHPGGSRHSTMDAGLMSTTVGAGVPAPLRRVYPMLPRWLPSLVARDSAWVSRSAVRAAVSSAGSPSDREKCTTLHT